MSDIADILASELHDLDLVPSDIAVGLILLQDEQEREQAERRTNGEVRCTRLQLIMVPRGFLFAYLGKFYSSLIKPCMETSSKSHYGLI